MFPIPYGSITASLSTNLRFRREYQAGSELFVVYTEGRSTLPPAGAKALPTRGVAVTINRLFRFQNAAMSGLPSSLSAPRSAPRSNLYRLAA